MSDFLTYRFPGKDRETKFGTFSEIDADEVKEGFVVSNFDFSTCYLFQEDEKSTKDLSFYFSDEEPYTMSAREYYLQAHELLNGLNLYQMDKAVFSRIKKHPFNPVFIEKLFQELEGNYPNAFVYLVSSEKFGTWIGASPEILIEAHKNFMFTTALAGTKKEDEIDVEWGEKEIFEQQIVTDYILDVCKKLDLKSVETQGPYDFQAGPVTHIRTDISAELNSNLPWKVAHHIHPSPAISGFPKERAISLIRTVEPHNRGLYTGVIGFVNENSAKLYVNLRCAQILENDIYLYLGGGFTNKSIPDLEWVETENKSKTILNLVKKIMSVTT
ncbi:MAG: chorismate-binding protein [Bacteroidota bacterium]